MEAGGQFRLFFLIERLPSDGLKKCSRCRDKDEYVGSNRHKFLPLLRVSSRLVKTTMRREGASRHSHRLFYIASIADRSDSIDRSPKGPDSTHTRNTLASALQSRTPSVCTRGVSASSMHTRYAFLSNTPLGKRLASIESVSEMRAWQREDRSALPTWFASVTQWKDCHMRGQGFSNVRSPMDLC